MFFEYALEPSLLKNWDRVRYFLDSFGPTKGRFLARYPKHWSRMVIESLSCADVEKKRITERLFQLQSQNAFSPRKNAQYDGKRSWLENAVAEDCRAAFHAIVAEAGNGARILDGHVLDESNRLWQVDSGALVARDPNALMQAVALLLRASDSLVFIDPYFRASDYDKIIPLLAAVAVRGALPERLEVHFAEGDKGYTFQLAEAERLLPRLLPSGVKVSLHCWRERAGGARLHNRYLVTDIGGLQFGDGIERGRGGQSDRVSVLDEPSRAGLWKEYCSQAPGFDLAGPIVTISGASTSEKGMATGTL